MIFAYFHRRRTAVLAIISLSWLLNGANAAILGARENIFSRPNSYDDLGQLDGAKEGEEPIVVSTGYTPPGTSDGGHLPNDAPPILPVSYGSRSGNGYPFPGGSDQDYGHLTPEEVAYQRSNGRIDPRDDIRCYPAQIPWWYEDGIFPSGHISAAYESNILKLCAKSPQGLFEGNLGGYCRHEDVAEWVLDFDPREGNIDLLQDPRLRIYCRMFCFCNLGRQQARPQRDSDGITTIPGQMNGIQGYTLGQAGPYVVVRRFGGWQQYIQVSPSSGTGSGSSSSSSSSRTSQKPYIPYSGAYDGQQSCTVRSSVDKNGRCTAPGPPGTYESRPPVCERARCKDLRCGWTGLGGCACVVSAYDVRSGLFQVATCAVLDSIRGKAAQRGIGGRSLGRRSSAEEGEVVLQEAVCPCNGSYVSGQCCHSNDGLVWEERLNLGGVAAHLWEE